MGLSDRDYVRDQPRGFFLGGDRSMVANLILINVGVYLADLLFDQAISEWGMLWSDLFQKPWNAWQLLTCGFLHAPSVMHVGVNMFELWLFGTDIEAIYGKREFLRLYLSLIVLSSLAWVASENLLVHPAEPVPMLGASGAVSGVLVLFALHFPRRLIYIWGVLPVPAWLLCLLFLIQNLVGFDQVLAGHHLGIAFATHLAGAALAFVYYSTGWNLGRLVPRRLSWSMFQRRPKLRVHEAPPREEDIGRQVDRILEKITREGEASLSQAERQTLEEASRRYQQRRK
ncbi:MAG TPA: rhomboid family intramembrane serine protease [Pirellulales bacterium]|nr:rhomboid family intramembrane serine protease [Pirellulales bacterium]